MSPAKSILRSAPQHGLAVLVALCVAPIPSADAAPTPASGSVSPVDTLVTWAGNITGVNAGPQTCQPDITCEHFELTVLPGDYTNKRVEVEITWLLPSNDYDLYIYADSVGGPTVSTSGQFATDFEEAFLNFDPPVLTEPRVFAVQAVAFSVTPGDNYSGRAEVKQSPEARTANYVAGNLTFSEDVSLRIPFAARDGEPSIKIDQRGNCYVGAIRGVPAGVDMWRFDLDPNSATFDPGMQNPTYLGQPDAFLPMDPEDPTIGGADGGGDIEISVSRPTNPADTPVLTISSLALANISTAISGDRGDNWTLSPATAIVPADDRQWNESTGNSTVYLVYRAPIPATSLFCGISQDNGFSFPVTSLISPTGTTPGHMDVDHANGKVYVSHQAGATCLVSVSEDGGLTWRTNTVDNTTSHGEIFDPVRIDDAGNAYVVWSDGKNVYMAHSTDGGFNWSQKVRVNDNSVYQTNLLPWLEAGSDGRVAVVWYGTTNSGNDNNADWEVLLAQTLDAKAQTPTFSQQVISDHIIHGSNISTGGLTGTDNRNLIDYFQVAIDPQGAVVVAYTDDHNDYDGHTMVTRQLDGISLYADANGTGMVNPASPPPLPDPDPSEPEVFDFLHDAVGALLQPIFVDNAYDILSIDYSCDIDAASNSPMIVADMVLSSLTDVPEGTNFRVAFSANAPGGVSDRGDQFFLQADFTTPVPVYTWGTTVRNGDGTLTYTNRGTPELGEIDAPNATIRMGVTFTQLNDFTTLGAITWGTVMHGLRGQTFTPNAETRHAVRDLTRGGTHFSCEVTAVGDEEEIDTIPLRSSLGVPNPNPTTGASSIQYALAKSGWMELSVFDARGRRVRTLFMGRRQAGVYSHAWDGRNDRFSDAANGVYFYMLHTPQGVVSQKVILAR